MDSTRPEPPKETYCIGYHAASGVRLLLARVGSNRERAEEIARDLNRADQRWWRQSSYHVYVEDPKERSVDPS